MVYTEECFDLPCLEQTKRAIQTFESGKTECTIDVPRGHDDHVFERVASQLGGKVVHHVVDREPGTDQVPRNYLEYVEN